MTGPAVRLLVLVSFGLWFVAAGECQHQNKKAPDIQSPELVTRVSHSGNVMALEFSFDGSILASASAERLILWNAATGDQLRTVATRGGISSQIAFDGSGQKIYLLSQVGILRYDLASNRSRVVLQGKNYGTFAVSPDGKWLAVEEASGITLVRLVHPEKRYVLEKQRDALHQVHPVLKFRKDSAKLAIGRGDGSVFLYSLGETISHRVVFLRDLEVSDLAFNPMGGVIVGGCFWESPTAAHCGLRIVDAFQKRVLREMPGFRPSDLKFSGDGVRLLAFGVRGDVSSLEAFDLRSAQGDFILDRKPMHRQLGVGPLRMIAGDQINYPIAVSRDGTWLALAPEPWNRLLLKEIAGSREVVLNAGSIFGIEQVEFVNKGSGLATWANSEVDLWNLARGGLVASWQTVGSFAVSRERFSIVFFNERKEIEIVDTRTLTSSSLEVHPQGIVDVVAATDFGESVVWSDRGIVTTYFERRRNSNGDPLELCHYSMTPVHSSGGSGDTVAFLCEEGNDSPIIIVWNLRTQTRKKIRADVETISLSLSPDDHFLAAVLLNGSISITELRTGRRRQLPKQFGDDYSAAAFQHDSYHLVAGTSDGTLRFWNLQSGKVVKRAVHSSEVTTITNGPTELIASGGYDGSVVLSDGRTHEVLGRLVSVRPNGWFAITDDGLFDGTPEALQWAGWRESWREPAVPLDAFFEDFYTPGILTRIFLGEGPKPIPGVRLGEKLKIPGLRVLLGNGLVSLQHKQGGLQLCMREKPTSGLIENLGLTFQGEPQVLDVNGFSSSSRSDCRYYVDLKGDSIDYELVSRYVAAARTPITTRWDDAMIDLAGATIHVQTVALAHYSHVPALDLRYPTVDADALEAYFNMTPFASNKNGPRIKIWESLRDEKATSAAVRSRLESIGKEAEENDVIILFLTGHGAIPPGEEMFYFLTSDVTGRTSTEIRASGLSVLMLADSIGRMRARRIVVFLDACLSGGTLDSLSKVALAKIRADEQSDSLDARVSTPSAVHVIAAATPFENAIELNSIGHGIFAKALLDTLNGPPVTLRALLPRLQERVDSLSTTLKRKQTAVGFSIGADLSLNPRPVGEQIGQPFAPKSIVQPEAINAAP